MDESDSGASIPLGGGGWVGSVARELNTRGSSYEALPNIRN